VTYEHSRLEAVALHEAAHYIVALALRMNPRRASLNADGGGHVQCRTNLCTLQDRRRYLAVLFAGMLAEHMEHGTSIAHPSHRIDHIDATRILQAWPREQRVGVQRKAMNAAAGVLRRRWQDVEIIRDELLDTGTWSAAA
jgi:hypothetical protein